MSFTPKSHEACPPFTNFIAMHATSNVGVGTGDVEAMRNAAGGANLASEADAERHVNSWGLPSYRYPEAGSKASAGGDNAPNPGAQPQGVEASCVEAIAGGANLASVAGTKSHVDSWGLPSYKYPEEESKAAAGGDNAPNPGAQPQGVEALYVEATRDVAGGANLAPEVATKLHIDSWGLPSSKFTKAESKAAARGDNAPKPGAQPQGLEALEVGGEVASGVEEPLKGGMSFARMWEQSQAVRNAPSQILEWGVPMNPRLWASM